MAFNRKEKIDEIVAKIKGNPDLLKNFDKDPVKTVESVAGVDLPDDQVKPLVEGVKAKLGKLDPGGIVGKIKNLF